MKKTYLVLYLVVLIGCAEGQPSASVATISPTEQASSVVLAAETPQPSTHTKQSNPLPYLPPEPDCFNERDLTLDQQEQVMDWVDQVIAVAPSSIDPVDLSKHHPNLHRERRMAIAQAMITVAFGEDLNNDEYFRNKYIERLEKERFINHRGIDITGELINLINLTPEVSYTPQIQHYYQRLLEYEFRELKKTLSAELDRELFYYRLKHTLESVNFSANNQPRVANQVKRLGEIYALYKHAYGDPLDQLGFHNAQQKSPSVDLLKIHENIRFVKDQLKQSGVR